MLKKKKTNPTVVEPSDLLFAVAKVLQEQTMTPEEQVVAVCSLIDEWQKKKSLELPKRNKKIEFAWYSGQIEALKHELDVIESQMVALLAQNAVITNPLSPIVLANEARLKDLETAQNSVMNNINHYTAKRDN